MTKNIYKRFVGLFMVLVLLFSTNLPVYASITQSVPSEKNPEVIYDQDNIRIEYYENDNSDKIFLEYTDNVLTQRNTIPHDEDDIIYREIFKSETGLRNGGDVIEDTLIPSDYVEKVEETQEIQPFSDTEMGTINYRALLDSGYISYGIKCSYSYKVGDSKYTINSFAGKVIDLVTILVSAIALPEAIAAIYIGRLCAAAGIAATGGIIHSAISTTVACDRTTYTWTLINTTNSSHKVTEKGYKYDVTDEDYKTDEVFYEGPVPKDWKKQSLAVCFHESMFSYPAWEVTGWK